MKKLLLINIILPVLSTALATAAGSGKACTSTTPNGVKYAKQSEWQTYNYQGKGDHGQVSGFVDKEGNFYFGNLSRKGRYTSDLKIDPSYKKFHKYCRKPNKYGHRLSVKREVDEGNSFSLEVSYLPKISGFANRPYRDLKLREKGNKRVFIEYNDGSIVSRAHRAEAVKQQIQEELQEQLENQKRLGTYKFDLSNLDDFVCDLIHGNAEISVNNSLVSQAALVEKIETVKSRDVHVLYDQMKATSPKKSDMIFLIFHGGQVLGSLVEKGTVDPIGLEDGVKVLEKFLNPSMTAMEDLSENQVQCVANSLHKYIQGNETHLFRTIFKIDRDQKLFGDLK